MSILTWWFLRDLMPTGQSPCLRVAVATISVVHQLFAHLAADRKLPAWLADNLSAHGWRLHATWCPGKTHHTSSVKARTHTAIVYVIVCERRNRKNGYQSHFSDGYCDIAMWIILQKFYKPILAASLSQSQSLYVKEPLTLWKKSSIHYTNISKWHHVF